MTIKNAIFAMLLTALVFVSPAVSKADSGIQGYFSALPDIPMMSGMDEVEDQTFVFDKAQGKVVETAGFLADSSPKILEVYYAGVLGQLGWKPMESGVFRRDEEQLSVKFEQVGSGALVKFQLAPLSR